MFGRYSVYICDNNGNTIFKGYFQSINRLAKILCCFDHDNVEFDIVDVVTDRSVYASDLINVFKNELIIL